MKLAPADVFWIVVAVLGGAVGLWFITVLPTLAAKLVGLLFCLGSAYVGLRVWRAAR